MIQAYWKLELDYGMFFILYFHRDYKGILSAGIRIKGSLNALGCMAER